MGIIDITVSTLVLLAKMNNYIASVSRDSLIFVLDQVISSLLDNRLAEPAAKLTTKSINKVKNFLDTLLSFYSGDRLVDFFLPRF